ncbi:DNA double-strand break repair Rad50 ATPase [uncultured archaeon]|nr:DNA double-strand break repair Rad50 ATPase [uncultured archaeon]
MLLKKLYIENLRSYEKQEVVFPKGSTLLSGDIGSGKTTVLLAIEFALFGLQPGQKGASLLRSNSEEAKVVLDFEVEGKQVRIERTLKRSKKSISQDYSSITIDNEKFEESVTEVKSKILKLLNYPQEFSKKTNLLYKFTVYTPQEEMKQIILEPDEIRLNTLRHVFGIDKYKRIEDNSALLTSRLREKIRINEGIIYNLDEIKEILNQKQNHLIELREKQKDMLAIYKRTIEIRSEKERIISEIQEKINQKKSLENEKSKSLVLISEKNQQVMSLQNSQKSITLQIEEAKKSSFSEEEYNSLNERIKFQESKEEELQKEYIQIIGKVNSEESRKREMQVLKIKISGLQKCPTCLQEVPEEYKKNILYKTTDELDGTEKILSELNLKKTQILDQISMVKKAKEEFKTKKSELELLKIKLGAILEKEKRIVEIIQQKQSIEKDIELLKKHVESIDASVLEYSKYDSIFDIAGKELREAKIDENNFAIKTAEVNKEIQFSESQIKEKIQEIEKKEELKRKTEKIRELEYWVSEKFMEIVLFTEKQVMLTLKEEFSGLFSKWFSILVSESLSAKLDDNFSPVIEQQDYELDYSFLSGGERTAIALAYRLSLNQVINSLLSNINTNDLVILDEPTDGFSSQQLDKMRDVLSQLNVEQLILVSHEQKIEGFVDNIIRLSKEMGITKVEDN